VCCSVPPISSSKIQVKTAFLCSTASARIGHIIALLHIQRQPSTTSVLDPRPQLLDHLSHGQHSPTTTTSHMKPWHTHFRSVEASLLALSYAFPLRFPRLCIALSSQNANACYDLAATWNSPFLTWILSTWETGPGGPSAA
jgi:hypothetical protein